MSGWTNTDGVPGDKPKYLNDTDKGNTFGADPDETAANPGIAHSGWVLKKEGSGGRAGRTQYETLVALSEMTSAADQDEETLAPFGAGSSSSSSAGV